METSREQSTWLHLEADADSSLQGQGAIVESHRRLIECIGQLDRSTSKLAKVNIGLMIASVVLAVISILIAMKAGQ